MAPIQNFGILLSSKFHFFKYPPAAGLAANQNFGIIYILFHFFKYPPPGGLAAIQNFGILLSSKFHFFKYPPAGGLEEVRVLGENLEM